MSDIKNQTYDFIALGETLIDFISSEEVDSLAQADSYIRFVGGQPTNLTRNMALLGNRVALGACVGDDYFGHYIIDQLTQLNIDPRFIQKSNLAHTTIVPVTRTRGGTPKFMIFRGADSLFQAEPALLEAVSKTRIIHTSAFAISREPARSTICQALKIAKDNDSWVSLDPNYHPAIWPDDPNFVSHLKVAFQNVDITKPSLDDCERIFGPGLEPIEYARKFINWGANFVILTMGANGVLLTSASGDVYNMFPNPISVSDVTGAGDAYWAGFLTAILDGRNPLEAAKLGQALAEVKIETVGPLTVPPDRNFLEEKAQLIRYQKIS